MDKRTAKMYMDDISIHIRQMKNDEMSLFKKIEAMEAELKSMEDQAGKLRKEVADLTAKKEQLDKCVEFDRREISNCHGELDALAMDIERSTRLLEQIRTETAVAKALQKSEVEHLERDKRLEQLIEHYCHLDQEDFAFRFLCSLGTKKKRDESGQVISEIPIVDIFLQSAKREKNRLLQDARRYVKSGVGNMTDYTDLEAWKRIGQSEHRLPSVNLTTDDSSGGSSPEPEL